MKTKPFRQRQHQIHYLHREAWAMFAFLLIASLMIFWLPVSGWAKDWPAKPINLIVPWATGGSTDIAARIIAPKLSKILEVPVQVINKAGGSGIIGTLEAIKAPPDGYTLLMDCNGTSSIQFAWADNLPYKPEERTYVARAMYTPEGVAVPASSPWKTVEDLMNTIRTNPSTVRWSTIGGTGLPDALTGQLRAAFTAKGLDLSKTRVVSYKGSGEVVIAIAGGHVDIAFFSPSVASSLLSAGKLRILAVAGDQRYKGWPNVPSTAELGMPSVNLVWWGGVCAPPGLPAGISKTISDAVRDTVRDPEVIAHLDKLGFVPGYQTEAVFKKFVMDESKDIKSLKLK